MGATAIEKHIIFLSGFDSHVTTVVEPPAQFLDGALGDRYEALLAALAHDAHELFVEVEVGELEVDELADAQATGEEGLDDGAVAMAFPLGEVDGGFELVDLGGGEHLGEVFANLGRLEEFGGIVVAVAVDEQKVVEGTDATEDAALGTGVDADVVETGGKMLQIFQGDVEHIFLLTGEIVEQFLKVALIGVERIARHAALELQVAHVAFIDVLAHILCKDSTFFCIFKKKT